MPRDKKIKLIDKIISQLTGKELISLVMFYSFHSEEALFKHTTVLKSESCGIGIVTTVRCIDCRVTKDITDYDCW